MALKENNIFKEGYDNLLRGKLNCCSVIQNQTIGGYPKELLPRADIVQLFLCSHCSHILRDPWQLEKSGLQYCNKCLEHVRLYHPEKISGSFEAFEDRGAQIKIQQLAVNCPLNQSGCTWKGSISTLDEHLENQCLFSKRECPNVGCLYSCNRLEMNNHISKECPYRIVICNACQLKCIAKEFDNHFKQQCVKTVVLCPNRCNTKLERGALENHYINYCPFVVVLCSFNKFGCNSEILRKDLPKHLSDSEHHINLFTRKIEYFENEIDKLTHSNASLTNQLSVLEQTEKAEVLINNRMLQLDIEIQKWQIELLSKIVDSGEESNNDVFYWKVNSLKSKIENGGIYKSENYKGRCDLHFYIEAAFTKSEYSRKRFLVFDVKVSEETFKNGPLISLKGDLNFRIMNQYRDEKHITIVLSANQEKEGKIVKEGESIVSPGDNKIELDDLMKTEKYSKNDCIILQIELERLYYSPPIPPFK